MNTSYFVLVSVALTFATGFFVASIIQSISWFLIPKEERNFGAWISGLFLKNQKKDVENDFSLANTNSVSYPVFEDSEYNQELYHYHHGEN
jgi:hypothetical protein